MILEYIFEMFCIRNSRKRRMRIHFSKYLYSQIPKNQIENTFMWEFCIPYIQKREMRIYFSARVYSRFKKLQNENTNSSRIVFQNQKNTEKEYIQTKKKAFRPGMPLNTQLF